MAWLYIRSHSFMFVTYTNVSVCKVKQRGLNDTHPRELRVTFGGGGANGTKADKGGTLILFCPSLLLESFRMRMH